MRKKIHTAVALAAVLVAGLFVATVSCRSGEKTSGGAAAEVAEEQYLETKMPFSADSVYQGIVDQLSFGPRVSGTEGNRRCASWIEEKMRQYGADSIILQDFDATVFTGDRLPMRNIMARFNGAKSDDRILLAAHYDTRPWSDRDRKPENQRKPIPGANDGGSGVAMLVEMARLFSQSRPDVGVDLLFVDGEDYGNSSDWENNDTTWCLGTQYWTAHKPADYAVRPPRYGVVLDMVGGRNARFHREYISEMYAQGVVDKIWGMASRMGNGRIFINQPGGSVIDDHYFINLSGIPCADIIDANNAETNAFPASWHTQDDDISMISRATLRYVGRTVTNLIYYEQP
ncbi:MAG: M28 family peptidase [Clostridium sp.]|nr:M28 family peptidase [Clostridium sp.]